MNGFFQIISVSVCLLFVSVQSVCAQLNYRVEHYTTAQGLSDNRIRAIIKDKEGFMWFATWAGINRFDGRNFVNFKSYPGDRSPLKSDRIDDIVEDRAGYLWVKAYDRLVYRFNKKNGQFTALSDTIAELKKGHDTFRRIIVGSGNNLWLVTENSGLILLPGGLLDPKAAVRFSVGGPTGQRLPSNTILFLHEDATHNVWISTSNGLVLLAKNNRGRYQVKQLGGIISKKTFKAFSEDTNTMEFGSSQGDLVSVNKVTKQLAGRRISGAGINSVRVSRNKKKIYFTTTAGELITLDRASGSAFSSKVDPGKPLLSIFEDKQGTLWIEPLQNGIVRFEPATGKFDFLAKLPVSKIYNTHHNYAVFEDQNGVLWANLKESGLCYYDSRRKDFVKLYYGNDELKDERVNAVSALYYDPAGVIWFAPENTGLKKAVFPPGGFTQNKLVSSVVAEGENVVRGLFRKRDRSLLVGTKAGKLYVWKNGQQRQLISSALNRISGGIYSVLEDRKGRIWLGTKENGLYKLTPSAGDSFRVEAFTSESGKPYSLSSNVIYSLLEDRKGRIWIGTFGGGLNILDESGLVTRFINRNNKLTRYPGQPYYRVRSLAEDAGGNIWIGTTIGLILADGSGADLQKIKFKTYTKRRGDPASLGGNDVQHILRDSRNRMWVSTSAGGLNQAIFTDPLTAIRFKNYNTSQGLPSDYVLTTTEDKNGNLWIATTNGLSKFHPASGRFLNFSTVDGLPESSFSEGTAQTLPDGQLVFGLSRGFLSFNPDSLHNRKIDAKLVFADVLINNHPIKPVNLAGGDVINDAKEIVLSHDENLITIDFALLDYRAADKLGYIYRLEGFDPVWRNSGGFSRATYTNVPPGQYTFKVKSLNAELYSEAPEKELRITIDPPPWKSWWAYTLYAMLALVTFLVVRRTALTMLKLRQRIEVERHLAELKMDFFTHVSHELRTPLTLILNPIEEIARSEKLTERGAGYVRVVKNNADRMMKFVNQLLDLRKIESGNATLHVSEIEVVSFVLNIKNHFAEVIERKHIQVSVESAVDELVVWGDADKLDVIIYNILSNALKFTPDDRCISIKIGVDGGYISIAIADQGPGVNPGEIDQIFNLFYEGEHNAVTSKGSGIGLTLVKELTELHGGAISASINTDGGLTIEVKLLTGRDHFREGTKFIGMKDVKRHEIPARSSQAVPGLMLDENAPLVLLVEDNPELGSFLRDQLQSFFRVEYAADGLEGLRKAADLLPDLVLSDIMMPKMDGIEMLDKLKNDPKTSHVPVILLSAKYSVESQVEGLTYGADYYITKPFNTGFLLAAINNVLKLRKALFESIVQGKSIASPGNETLFTAHDKAFLERVICTVEAKMPDPNFNIDTVAGALNMSRSSFYKKFSSLTGIAPVEFVRDMRLKKAIELINEGETNISTIAFTVGFSNAKYFSTCFRAKFDQTPSDFVKDRKLRVNR